MSEALLSDADLGLSYPAPAGDTEPGAEPGELTVHPARRPAPTPVLNPALQPATPAALGAPIPGSVEAPAQGVAPGVHMPAAARPSAERLLSDEDLGIAQHNAGILSNASDDSYLSGAAKGTGTAAVKAVGNSLGFVGGLGNFADYLLARAEHAITGKPVETILDELHKQKQEVQHSIGAPAALDPRNVLPAPADVSEPILKRTGEYVPTTEPGKLAQSGAEAALSMLGPGAGAKAGTYGQVLRGAAEAAPAAFTAGAAGQGVTDLTGDPLAGMAAGLIVPAAAGAGTAAVKKVAGPVVMGIPGAERLPIVGPKIAEARDTAAGQKILGSSEDPVALRDWAAQPEQPSEVPGSPRTLAGTMGDDRRLFQAEKAARGVDNTDFNKVDDAQSAAQRRAITAPYQTGDVFRPGQVIRERLSAIDAAHDTAVERLQAAHEAAIARRQEADARDLDRMTVAFREAYDRASQAAIDAAAPLNSVPTAEHIGATLRTAQEEATGAAKAARKTLYDAVDPDGTLATAVTPLREAKDRIAATIDPHTGVQPAGAEAELWKTIDRLPDVIPFQSLQKLDSRVTAAMADARRNPNANDPEAISRLTQLKSAVMDAIDNGVEHAAAHEARLVEAGVMPSEDALEARIAQWRDEHLARQQEARMAGNSGYAGAGSGTRPDAAARSLGAASQKREGSRGASGNQGFSSASVDPNIDEAALNRLRSAKQAHAAFERTYRNPTVKGVLETNGFAGQYKMPNSAIPAQWVRPGDKGYETARAYLAASNNDPRAVSAMQAASLNLLRKHFPPAGNLHPNAVARWKQEYEGVLRALDEVSPGFSSRFDNAANATQTMLDLGVQQKRELADFQREAAARGLTSGRASKEAMQEGVARERGIVKNAYDSPSGKFAGQGGERISPIEVENAVGNMLKTGTQGATRMRSLVGSVASDADALTGLRKAGTDWMVRTFVNTDGNMSGAAFMKFIRDNRDVLKELYPTGHVSMLGAVAHDMEVNARWRTQTAIKGGSDTVKNIKPMLEKAVDDTKRHISIMSAAGAGYLAGGAKGAATGAALYLLNSLRSAGIRSVEDLYREAFADPEKARMLISKMPAAPEGGKLRALTSTLRRELIVGQQQTSQSAAH